ncbi:glycosyl hydrolase family 18 protein [Streptomyces sp. NPDC050738]|uniref:glycosyl hydrolase family 18 protein n=1 Tax=Streptomyces sp. NPDC050738 TaxID=3154744 RepID=UPI003445B39F
MVIPRLALLAASGLLLGAACPPDPAPDPAPAPPAAVSAHRTVSAWLPYWDQEGAYRDALRHASQLHTVSPFWYQAKSATRIDRHPGAGERRIVDGLHRAGIKVVPTVMETLRPGALAAIVTAPAKRAAHIRALSALARTRGYDGIDIDYETIAPTGTAKYRTVRAGYAAFMTGLCAALHAQHKQCIATVSPQTPATGRIWDYRAIGRAADRVRIMAYNLHWAGGPAGPLSGAGWYEEILRRATALIPRHKIEMALPAYGWNWRADGKGSAKHVTWKEAEALRRKTHARYRLDPVSKTPYFTYREGKVKRTVWYQDARGVAAHLPALRKYGVVNTGLWALNFEDPGLWKVLARG